MWLGMVQLRKAGKRIVEVRSRVGGGEKQASVAFELQVELEPFGGGSRPMIYGRHRRSHKRRRCCRRRRRSGRSRPGTGTVRLADVKRNALIRFPRRRCGHRIGQLTAH